jgi:hypothetical protein
MRAQTKSFLETEQKKSSLENQTMSTTAVQKKNHLGEMQIPVKLFILDDEIVASGQLRK